MPPRPQPPGVRLSGRLRPAVQPLPGSAAPGDLRRAAAASSRSNWASMRRGSPSTRPGSTRTRSIRTRIRDYLKLVVFDTGQAQALERFVFEESCRLEQTASLLARAREFLKGRRVLFPAESALLRLVGEQKKRAREHIVAKLAGGLSPGVIEGPRRPAGGEGGRGDFRPPGDQGQPGQALGDRHAGPRRQAGRHRGHRHPGRRPLLVERQLPTRPVPLRPQVLGGPPSRGRPGPPPRGPGLLPPAELPRRRRPGGGHVRQAPHPDPHPGRARAGRPDARPASDDQGGPGRAAVAGGDHPGRLRRPPPPCDRGCSPPCPETPWRPRWRGWTNGSPARRATCSTASSGGSATCGSSRRSCSAPWSSYRTPATATSPAWRPFGSSRR